jgi:hypothetical protein
MICIAGVNVHNTSFTYLVAVNYNNYVNTEYIIRTSLFLSVRHGCL